MSDRRKVLGHVRRIALQRTESLARAGVAQIRKCRVPAPPQPVAEEGTPAPPPAVSGKAEPRRDRLAILQQEVAGCTRCKELARTRTQTVFGSVNLSARLCFLGEAPGADEDRQGVPFVGRAGQLLTDIIEKGMGIRREDVCILNVLKCRPPNNRTPSTEEVAHCRGYLERQLEILQPEFICCLGLVAAHALLQTSSTVGRLREQFHEYEGAKVLVTYHPSYLLRQPEMKKEAWLDIQKLMREMGLPVPRK